MSMGKSYPETIMTIKIRKLHDFVLYQLVGDIHYSLNHQSEATASTLLYLKVLTLLLI
jgi:hypothetical protein